VLLRKRIELRCFEQFAWAMNCCCTAPRFGNVYEPTDFYTIYARGIKKTYKLVLALNLPYIEQPSLPIQAKLNSEEPSALQAVASQATQKAPSQQASQATGAWLGLACLLTSLLARIGAHQDSCSTCTSIWDRHIFIGSTRQMELTNHPPKLGILQI
jgi:hypothetical protein